MARYHLCWAASTWWTLAPVQALAEKYPDLHIIHFDAHADLRDDYLGAKLSHACVLRRCWEVLGDGRITQFGIRSGDREEWRWGKEHVTTHPFIVDMEVLQETLRKLEGKPVYFTLDLDVLDPSVFPEQERRNRAESVLRNFDGQSRRSAAQLGLLDVM